MTENSINLGDRVMHTETGQAGRALKEHIDKGTRSLFVDFGDHRAWVKAYLLVFDEEGGQAATLTIGGQPQD